MSPLASTFLVLASTFAAAVVGWRVGRESGLREGWKNRSDSGRYR